jgi:1-acyl-sn-glycerol-3-phosphate acyltransferase
MFMLPNFLLTRAYGLENLAGAERASIYAFNHNNSLEALMVPALLMYHLGGSSISFVIDWMYGKVPVLGSLMNMIDPVYVYHKRSTLSWIEAIRPHAPSADTIERCSEKLRAGRSIGIFPEGKRNKDPETLLIGKSGVGHIALQSGATVVPVGIDFNCRTSRGKIPVFGRTIVRIGRPILFRQQSDAYRALMPSISGCSRQHSELNHMADEVTHEIMLCLAELSGKRYREPFPRDRRSFS